jgi:hypothetical protein
LVALLFLLLGSRFFLLGLTSWLPTRSFTSRNRYSSTFQLAMLDLCIRRIMLSQHSHPDYSSASCWKEGEVPILLAGVIEGIDSRCLNNSRAVMISSCESGFPLGSTYRPPASHSHPRFRESTRCVTHAGRYSVYWWKERIRESRRQNSFAQPLRSHSFEVLTDQAPAHRTHGPYRATIFNCIVPKCRRGFSGI